MKPLKLNDLYFHFASNGILVTDGEPQDKGQEPKCYSITPGASKVMAKHYAQVFRVFADHFNTVVKSWAEETEDSRCTVTVETTQENLSNVAADFGVFMDEYRIALTEAPWIPSAPSVKVPE